jgi:hypothetical protein
MKSSDHPLVDSLEILHSFFLAVFIPFILEIPVISLFFSAQSLQFLLPFIFLILLPVKIAVYAGIYGGLAVLASQKEYILTGPLFWVQVKKFWGPYAALQSFLFLIQFLSFILLPSLDYTYWNIFLEPVGVMALCVFILKRDYFTKKQPSLLRVQVPIRSALWLLSLVAMQISCQLLLKQWHLKPPMPAVFLSLASKYIHALMIIFFYSLIFQASSYRDQHPQPKKELLLINPLGGGSILELLTSVILRFYPPVFVVLSALTPPDYTVRSFSRVFWRSRYVRSGRLVAITCFTSNCFEAYKIAKEFRAAGSTVIMGGPHVSFIPQEALEFCDSVVIGEVEGIWREIIADHENNRLQKIYQSRPADKTVHEEIYQKLLTAPPEIIHNYLEATHGCKFRCSFCCVSALCQGQVGHKTVEQVIALIKRLQAKYKVITFIDNNIYSDPAYAKQLFTAIKPLKIKWIANCSIDIAANEPVLKLARESGCQALLVGYEISNYSLEKAQGEKFALAERYVELTKRIHKTGIRVEGHFIIGFDSDRPQDLLKYWRCCFRIFPHWTSLSVLTPLPGTRLYRELLEEERILNLNWRNYSCYWPVFQAKHFSHTLLSWLHPALFFIFLFTTCRAGMFLLLILVATVLGSRVF